MTTLQLLESMEKELKKVFSGMLFRRPSGEMEESTSSSRISP